MILVDVHAHLEFPEYKHGLGRVLERARNAGVVAIIANGVHDASNRKVLQLAAKYPIIKPALGLYPLDAPNVTVIEGDDYDRSCRVGVDETIKRIRAHKDEIVAIGEVGIDLKYSDDEEHQIENFTKLLRLSNQIKRPLIIHSRKAEKLILDLLQEAKHSNAVLHCFSGSRKLVKRAVDQGLKLTVMSNAKRLQHFQMVAREVPMNHLLTETDAPYMSPTRGETNEPQHVKEAIEVIARQKGLNAEEVARQIYWNYQRTFA